MQKKTAGKPCCKLALCILFAVITLFLLAFAVGAELGSCAFYNGVVCVGNEECFNGVVFSSPDSERCCLNGVCMLPGEFAEILAKTNAQPSMTTTPSGELASVVLEAGVDEYCLSVLNGSICLADEYCEGESLEYYLGRHCCLGKCIILPQEILSKYDYGGGTDSPDTMSEDDWEGLEFREGEVSETVPENNENVSSEESIVEGKEMVDYIEGAVSTVSGRINWLYVAAIVLGIVVLVMVFMAIFVRRAQSELQRSGQAGQQEVEGPVNLQSQIDSLISEGFNYVQVKEELIRRGYPQMLVTLEIQKNYQSRKVRV